MADFNRRSTAEQVTDGLDLSGKQVLVTGVNSGLGYEAMRVLAMRGAHVFGAARTLDKAKEACDSVAGDTTPVVCELENPDSVVQCAQSVIQQCEALDILMNNAGIMSPAELQLNHNYGVALEAQFATNHMGHFVLVNRLLEHLKKAEQGRIVALSSGGHVQVPKGGIDFDNLDCSKGYNAWQTYGQSKLANILMAKELARQLQGTSVTANAVHPGVIRTNLSRNMGGFFSSLISFFATFFERTVAQGAATQVYVATRPELANTSGEYFADCQVKTPSDYAQDAALAQQLWEHSLRLAGEFL